MTAPMVILGAVVSAIAAWSVPAWLSSQRVRSRVADTGRGLRIGGATAAGADRRLPRVPPVALVAGGAGVAIAAFALGPIVPIMCVAAAAVAPLAARRRHRTLAHTRRRSQLPQALERLAGALRSGSSLPVALGEAGRATADPLGPELTAVAHGAAQGQPMATVLDDWTRRHDDAGTRLAATALVLASVVGAAPARAVDGVAATLRERLELGAERRALASQARTSAVVLSAAPLLFAGLLGMSDGAAARFLLHTRAGWACLAVGLVLDALGAWWMARLTRGNQP